VRRLLVTIPGRESPVEGRGELLGSAQSHQVAAGQRLGCDPETVAGDADLELVGKEPV
jgi:hypothetical protein